MALSFFALDESLGPIDYLVGGEWAREGRCTRFGLEASADVGLSTFRRRTGLLVAASSRRICRS